MVVSLALLEYGLGEERQRHPVRLGHAAADERKAAAAARGAAASARTAAAAKTRELRLVDSGQFSVKRVCAIARAPRLRELRAGEKGRAPL